MKENPAKAVNDASRRVRVRGKQAIIPLKFDADGNPATDGKIILKRLTLNDLHFLGVWRNADWDINIAIRKSGFNKNRVEFLVRKLRCFRNEDAKVKALAEIPTPAWISAKHVENVYEGGGLEESERDSLKELAKISGAYKTQASLSITQNVFNLPKLSPETEAQLKAIAQRELAVEVDAA